MSIVISHIFTYYSRLAEGKICRGITGWSRRSSPRLRASAVRSWFSTLRPGNRKQTRPPLCRRPRGPQHARFSRDGVETRAQRSVQITGHRLIQRNEVSYLAGRPDSLRVDKPHIEIPDAFLAVRCNDLVNCPGVAIDPRAALCEMIAPNFKVFESVIGGIIDRESCHHDVVKPTLAPVEIQFDLSKERVFRGCCRTIAR